ncbi:hypothetical protein NIES4071_67690 [Calothrix sp. NIES-4071]|nr:hypothetical protein NIES4071_67690 [Calothrix sp. NIES-4071]BAZ61047.1 hypothetical protein NIES4105_67650 [Calothrix sp. NIES-4105]
MSTTNKLSLAVFSIACIVFGTANVAGAATTKLTFDELGSPTPVDNLTVKGVTFDFKIDGVDSNEAMYNASFPPQLPSNLLANLQQPSLQGNAQGILSLDFAAPVEALEFAVGIDAIQPLAPGFVVELLDQALNSLETIPVNTAPLAILSEGLFKYSGVPIKKAIVSFNSESSLNPNNPRFSLDNLTYTNTTVPEPSSLIALLASSAISACLYRVRKQQKVV